MYPRVLLLVALLRYSTCQRRIVGGVRINKPYVVYIVWDNSTKNEFADFNTICGGVLLSPNYVLTSSVCLFMHPAQYVIAGYNRYIPRGLGRTEQEKECLTIAKRYITQRNYSGTPDPWGKWYLMDIGVATLETPYDFKDDSFDSKCSYKPAATDLIVGGPAPGEHVVLLGWGSAKYQAPEHYDIDINEDFLRATSTIVIDSEDCKEVYNTTGGFNVMNEPHYRFCTDGEGSLDAEGKYIGLYRRHVSSNGTEDQCLFALNAENVFNKKIDTCVKKIRSGFRRNGSCQNDLGGPVVKYIDGIEHVVGVLSTYLVNSNMECVGPSVSTEFVDKHVYIVWDNSTKNEFADFNTICGGVLLSPNYVLTSSVCLFMHPAQYVVAGYNRYIPRGLGRTEQEKECLTIAKRYITQRNYSDTPDFFGKWYYMDLGVATLETPYDFKDDSFERKCSYKPTATELEPDGPEPGDHVVILGWGSTKYQAPEHYDIDMNEDYLRATSTIVINDGDCEEVYNMTGEINVINTNKYRFCTDGEGSLDADGKYISLYRRHVSNNDTKDQCLFALNAENVFNKKIDNCVKKLRSGFRRNGSCQNDHGGPVVKYINGLEYVVGVLTSYLVNSNLECVGPTMSTKFVTLHVDFLHKFNIQLYDDRK